MMELLGVSHARLKQLLKQDVLLAEKHDGRDFGFLPLEQQPALARLRAQKAAAHREQRALDASATSTLGGV